MTCEYCMTFSGCVIFSLTRYQSLNLEHRVAQGPRGTAIWQLYLCSLSTTMSATTRELMHSLAGPLKQLGSRGEQPLDESKIGDSLLFITEDGSTVTMVVSAYSNTTYYTIVTEGAKTSIYKGSGKVSVLSRSMHIATVSAALRGHVNVWDTFWNWNGGASSPSQPPQEAEKSCADWGNEKGGTEKQPEKADSCGDDGSDDEACMARGHLLDKTRETDLRPRPDPSSISMTLARVNERDRTREDEMLFTQWGKEAASSIGGWTVRIDKTS